LNQQRNIPQAKRKSAIERKLRPSKWPAKEVMFMRVAFATTGQDEIDVHFGIASAFAVYDVTPEDARFIGMVYLPEEFSEVDTDKVQSRAELLRECAVVYCTQIGGPAAARLVQQNIHPIKAKDGTPIKGELQRFQSVLQGNPPPWLRKRLIEEMQSKEERV
jgi:nitrogen fixation protein NifX